MHLGNPQLRVYVDGLAVSYLAITMRSYNYMATILETSKSRSRMKQVASYKTSDTSIRIINQRGSYHLFIV